MGRYVLGEHQVPPLFDYIIAVTHTSDTRRIRSLLKTKTKKGIRSGVLFVYRHPIRRENREQSRRTETHCFYSDLLWKRARHVLSSRRVLLISVARRNHKQNRTHCQIIILE